MSDMAIAPAYAPHRITTDEYHRMAAAGVFDSDARIELIDGELIERVAPMYPPHAGTVSLITDIFGLAFAGRAAVRNQVPVTLPSSEPQPDIAVVAFDAQRYFRRHPEAADTYLIVEVCDSTRDADRRLKIPVYARAGIREVWLVDLVDFCILTHRDPSDGRYATVGRLERGKTVRPLALPDLEFAVSELLPPAD